MHRLSRRRAALTLALTALASACAHEAPPQSAPPATQVEAQSCLVDGEPLESIAPPASFCNIGLPSEPLVNALRSYQQERYVEAAAGFEHEVSGGRDPEWPKWWQRARFYLAKTYRHLGRGPEAEALLLEIVRSHDDPYRWVAAGRLCGDLTRQPPENMFRGAECPVFAGEPSVVIAAGPIPPRDGPVVPNSDPLPMRPYASVVHRAMRAAHATIVACRGPADGSTPSPAPTLSVEYVFSSNGTVQSVSVRSAGSRTDPPLDPRVERCVQEAARRVWLPPFTDATFSTSGHVFGE